MIAYSENNIILLYTVKKGVLRTLMGVIFKQATEHPLGCSAVAIETFDLWDLNQCLQ